MMEHIPYALLLVPNRGKEHIAYGVIPFFVCYYINGGNSLFFSRDAVGPVQIESYVIDVRVRQRAVFIPLPAKLSCNMDPAAHFVEPYRAEKHRIMLKDRYVILQSVHNGPVLRRFEHGFHLLDRFDLRGICRHCVFVLVFLFHIHISFFQ